MEVFLTPEELATSLKVSRVAVYKWVRLQKIPFYRVMKCVRFSVPEIEAWLQENHGKEWHRDKV